MPEFITVKEIAAELGVGKQTIYRLLRAGGLRHTVVGGRKLIRRSDWVKYLSEHTHGGNRKETA